MMDTHLLILDKDRLILTPNGTSVRTPAYLTFKTLLDCTNFIYLNSIDKFVITGDSEIVSLLGLIFDMSLPTKPTTSDNLRVSRSLELEDKQSLLRIESNLFAIMEKLDLLERKQDGKESSPSFEDEFEVKKPGDYIPSIDISSFKIGNMTPSNERSE